MRPQNMTPDEQTAFRLLPQPDLKAARAWLLKERFATFWGYPDPGAAEKFAARGSWRATHSRLTPMASVAKFIKRHLPNLLTYLTHKITNAGLEAVNSVIQGVKKTARGSATQSTSRSPSTSGAVDSTSTHTKAGRARFSEGRGS